MLSRINAQIDNDAEHVAAARERANGRCTENGWELLFSVVSSGLARVLRTITMTATITITIVILI